MSFKVGDLIELKSKNYNDIFMLVDRERYITNRDADFETKLVLKIFKEPHKIYYINENGYLDFNENEFFGLGENEGLYGYNFKYFRLVKAAKTNNILDIE